VGWVGGTLYATLYSKKHQSMSLDYRESKSDINDGCQAGIVSHNSAARKRTATILSACMHSVLTPGMPIRIIASYFADVQHM
jgi:hypothetical protein